MKNFRTMIIVILATAISMSYVANAQVSINTDGTDADASAMLDVKSTNKGFLPPRVADTNAISNPVAGLMVYDQSSDCMRYYNGLLWSNCMGGIGIQPFSCGDDFVDSRDSQTYTTVQIGTQCWMAENLNIGTMISGNIDQTNNGTIEKYCYNNSSTNCDTYGGLYQWDEMMQYVTTEGTQGICPPTGGWHLPSDTEWKTMEMYLGMTQSQANGTGYRGTDEGGKLKESGTTHWSSPNTGATNSSGFTGLSGGYRNTNGAFTNLALVAYFWTSSENEPNAWNRYLHYSNARVGRYDYNQAYGFSVRCLRD